MIIVFEQYVTLGNERKSINRLGHHTIIIIAGESRHVFQSLGRLVVALIAKIFRFVRGLSVSQGLRFRQDVARLVYQWNSVRHLLFQDA